MDTKERAFEGSEFGPVIRPANADGSTLYTTTVLPVNDPNVMPPPRTALSVEQSETLRRWIETGAKWPDDGLALRPVRRVSWYDISRAFKTSCVSCHGKNEAKGGLRLHTKDAILKGGDSGSVVVPHYAESSLLYTKLQSPSTHDSIKPPRLKDRLLTEQEMALLRDWINQGAAWPRDE